MNEIITELTPLLEKIINFSIVAFVICFLLFGVIFVTALKFIIKIFKDIRRTDV